jgi:hypothetical protein
MNGVRICMYSRRMQFKVRFESFLEISLQQFIFISKTAVLVAIPDISWCARLDGLLMPNVSNSYEQQFVRIQELEVG